MIQMQAMVNVFWGAFFGGMCGVLVFFILVGLYTAVRKNSSTEKSKGVDSGA